MHNDSEDIDFRKMKLEEYADLIHEQDGLYILDQANRSVEQYNAFVKIRYAFERANKRQMVMKFYKKERSQGCTIEESLENISKKIRWKVGSIKHILFGNRGKTKKE